MVSAASYRQKVTESLNQPETLINALQDEDKKLRAHLADIPRSIRSKSGPDGGLSFKETLGHIAYWDNFTVEFFAAKLNVGSFEPAPPVDFEERSQDALKALVELPFGEVLARYLEATGALQDFVKTNWGKLSARERHDFWVPVKHRRHHRIGLEGAIRERQGGEIPGGQLNTKGDDAMEMGA